MEGEHMCYNGEDGNMYDEQALPDGEYQGDDCDPSSFYINKT